MTSDGQVEIPEEYRISIDELASMPDGWRKMYGVYFHASGKPMYTFQNEECKILFLLKDIANELRFFGEFRFLEEFEVLKRFQEWTAAREVDWRH